MAATTDIGIDADGIVRITETTSNATTITEIGRWERVTGERVFDTGTTVDYVFLAGRIAQEFGTRLEMGQYLKRLRLLPADTTITIPDND